MKRITIFALLFLLGSISTYSQELKTVTYNYEEYYVLPDTFYSHLANVFSEYPGYISSFNLPDGKWISFTKSVAGDFPLATGAIVNGHPEGKWYFYSVNWDDTTSYITSAVSFNKGVAEGDYYYYHKNGEVQGLYEVSNNKFHGAARFFNYNGKLSLEGAYMYGNRSGTWKYYDSYGKLYQIESYKEEIPDIPRGVMQKQAREEGKDVLTVYATGRMKTIIYIPYAEGLWARYDEEGKPVEEKIYSEGVVVYVKAYHNGVLVSEGETAGEIEPGPQKRSYSPREEIYVKKGVWKYYDKNGNLLKTELFE